MIIAEVRYSQSIIASRLGLGLGVKIAINVFTLQIFCRRQSSVVGNPIHTAEADATQTKQFRRVWRGGVNYH